MDPSLAPAAATAPVAPLQSCQAQNAAQDVPDNGSMDMAETAQLSGSGSEAAATAGTAVPLLAQQKKHHLLRHALSQDAKAAAARHFRGALPEESAALIVTLQQRELRDAFTAVYGVETRSCNNGWMRGKLLQALGLSSHWQPPRDESEAPTPPPPRPAAEPGAEVSRYGRRVTRKRWAGSDGGDSAAEPSPRDSTGGGKRALAGVGSSATTKRARTSTSPRTASSKPAAALPAFPPASIDSPSLLGGWQPLPPPPLPHSFTGAFSQPHVRIVMAKSSTPDGADVAPLQRQQPRDAAMGPSPPLPLGQGGAAHPPASCSPAPHGLSMFQKPPAWPAPGPLAERQASALTPVASLQEGGMPPAVLPRGGSLGNGYVAHPSGMRRPSVDSAGDGLPPAGILHSAGNSMGEGSLLTQGSMPGGHRMLSVAVMEEQQRLYELKRQQLELEKQALELDLQQEQQRRQLEQQQQQLVLLQQQRMRELRMMAQAAAAARAAPQQHPPPATAPREGSPFAQQMALQQPLMGGGEWAGAPAAAPRGLGGAAEPRGAAPPAPPPGSWDPWTLPVGGLFAAEESGGVWQGGQLPPGGPTSCRPVSGGISAELHFLFASFEEGQGGMRGLV